jgi:hypothetical protein
VEDIPATTESTLKNMVNHNEPSSVTPPTIEDHVEEVKKDTIISATPEDQHDKFIVHNVPEDLTTSIAAASKIESTKAIEEVK